MRVFERQVADRLDRWRRLTGPDPRPGFVFQFVSDDSQAPPVWAELKRERIEWAWERYKRLLARLEWLDDDSLPYLHFDTGTEVFAEAFGCPVHRPDGNKPFALPLIQSAADADRVPEPELSGSSLAYIFDCMDELRRRAGPEALVRSVDIQSPVDIAALILEKSEFLAAMIEAPEAVQSLIAKVERLLTAFLDEWFKRYGTTHVAHYPDYPMFGGLTLSEDEVGAFSEEMFAVFCSPVLTRLSRRYGGIGIHCCADCRHQWGNFAAIPGLRLINLCKPPTRSPDAYMRPALQYFRDVCAQWPMSPSLFTGAPGTWPDQYPAGCRMAIGMAAKTRDDAIRMAAEMRARQGGHGCVHGP